MKASSTLKKAVIATAVIALAVSLFLIHALAGLSARPVVFADPPGFVERYAEALKQSESSPVRTEGGSAGETESLKVTADFSAEDTLVRNVILGGDSPAVLLQLFAHADKTQRVKGGLAFAAVNAELTHDEPSGFAEKRSQFWVDVEEHLPDIQNALFEALIATAEEGTSTRIPYTLAWMPGQGRETIEVLAWAAEYHPDPWVRRFSVFFVVEYGQDEDLADRLLQNRTHDPAYKVRKEVLEQRFRRFIGNT